MRSNTPTVHDRRPANLAALQKSLNEMAAKTKPTDPTATRKPVVIQGPVLVIKGK